MGHWSPWIQLENKRVGKWLNATDQGRVFGGAVDEDGTAHLTEDDLEDARAIGTRGLLSLGETETTPVTAAKEVAARTLALNRTGQSLDYNFSTDSAVALAQVVPPDSAVFTDAAVIASGLAYLNQEDSFHWVTEYPDWHDGIPMEWHPDDYPEDLQHGDWGEVLGQWSTVAWDTASATADPFFDSTPNIRVGYIDPSTTAQLGIDTGYAFRVDAWPDTLAVSSALLGTAGVPPAVVGGWGFVGPFTVSSRDGLVDRGGGSTLPYLIDTDALTAWSWAVDGTTVREAHFPLFPRIITDFYYRPARFRLWIEDSAALPYCRVWPREDSFGPSPRVWPQPRSFQTPGRAHGYI